MKKLSKLAYKISSRNKKLKPPIHLWNPIHSGAINILIKKDGSWWHEGNEIHRKPLIKLFASVLRKESDDQYYLVTPEEKWQIEVEFLPLIIIAVKEYDSPMGQCIDVVLNTEEVVPVNDRHKIEPLETGYGSASVILWNGLSALFNRSSWYDLADICDNNFFVESRGNRFNLLEKY